MSFGKNMKGIRVFIEKNLRLTAVMGEVYTGSKTDVFEGILTPPPNRISYTNMVANEGGITMIAKQRLEMKFRSEVPNNLMGAYLDMQFAEQLVPGK